MNPALTSEELARARVFGIDFIALSAPVVRLPEDWRTWRHPRIEGWRQDHVELAGGGSFQLLAGSVQGGVRMSVSFNPARIADPLGWGPCPIEDLRRCVEIAWDEVRSRVDVLASVGDARVTRLDVARDFSVAFPYTYVEAWSRMRRKYEKTSQLYADPTTGRGQTLMVGSKSGGFMRAYDKHIQNSIAPEGTLRLEFECREWTRRYGGIDRFDDVGDLQVARLGLDRWGWSGAGAPICDLPVLVRHVRDLDVPPARRAELLGWFILAAFGEETAKNHPRLNDFTRNWGVGLSPDLLCTHQTPSKVQLDLLSGLEINEDELAGLRPGLG